MNVEPTGTPPGVRALPANVVTFLLSDIVGSTRLWDESAAAMARSLLRHDELVAAAVARHGGVLLKSKGEGDSTFSVFTRATDGADAALAVQQAIAAETWPPDTPIVVRMSLYTGEVVERGGDYYGTVVNRAARLRSLAGPGEVLVGQSTADLLADHLAPPAVLTELGLRQLKDLNRPELVYSLRSFVPALSPTQNASEDDYYGRPEDPTRSTATNGQLVIALPSHVERPETSGFFGRAEEFDTITAAMAAVRREGWRQSVLLGGEPGIGKTRLALEAARRIHADGDVTVLCGRAMEGGSQPFHAFAEALTHLVRELPVGLLVEHVRIHGGELALVVPEVRSRVPQTPPARGHDQESDRYLVFGAIAALIESVTKSQPLMLVLDDLQWADTSSLQLLRHLTQAADIRNLLLLVTFRNTDVDPSSANSICPLKMSVFG